MPCSAGFSNNVLIVVRFPTAPMCRVVIVVYLYGPDNQAVHELIVWWCTTVPGNSLYCRHCQRIRLLPHLLLLPVPCYAASLYFAGQELLLAQSYAKNMGLYGERIGALSIVCSW